MGVNFEQKEMCRRCSFVTLQETQNVEFFDGRSRDLLKSFEHSGLELKVVKPFLLYFSQDLMGKTVCQLQQVKASQFPAVVQQMDLVWQQAGWTSFARFPKDSGP